MRPTSRVWDAFVIVERDGAGRPRRVSCKQCNGMRAANCTKMTAHLLQCTAEVIQQDASADVPGDEDTSLASQSSSLAISDDVLDDSMSMTTEEISQPASTEVPEQQPSRPRRFVMTGLYMTPSSFSISAIWASELWTSSWTGDGPPRSSTKLSGSRLLLAL